MAIEKCIHYIWLGSNEIPLLYKECIETWGQYNDGWEIKFWNENNIPNDIPYVNRAIEEKKFAFASDCLRVHILKKFGGIYLDADMELIKPLDELMHSDAFLGYEREGRVSCGIMAFSKDHILMSQMCDYYNNNVGKYVAIPRVITSIIEKGSFKNIEIYSPHYFYPYNPFVEGTCSQLLYKNITSETYAIHHWGNSWEINFFDKVKNKCIKFLRG
ncbi:glycosyltransferase family 32 protein [Aliivibrio fischeri]|uniref:glycosyltransferase family 32 protein n=1 Tax=Aliivibrio fischeri TaxID=668 RepID=UPI0012DAE823|nr:capsular polysaccharide synthesis protein [Aliivibrio fischeri]MUK67958.1 polysaccharide biosynthesis protein [Aliivibrio fischeri]MUK72905.1 polysaccharide biosynthesis protein [Aliivibrio fischeri]